MFELEYHGEFTSIRIAVKFCAVNICTPRFSDCDQIALLECLPAQFPDKFMQSRTIICNLPIRFLCNLINHIQAEASGSFVHPPKNHVIDFSSYFWILPVEIRLFYGKLVEIILSQFGYPLPCRPSEDRAHIVWEYTLLPISPYIIVMVWIVLALFCLLKPSVFIGRMIQHKIYHNADISFSCLPNQLLHIIQTSKHRINILIIGNIISVIILRGSAYR